MELRKHLSLRFVFIGLYFVAFLAFIIYGLQPADAVEAYDIGGEIAIPSIGLQSDVAILDYENGKLNTPDTIVGSYEKVENKSLLIGHSTTVFSELYKVKLGDEIEYKGKTYEVKMIDMMAKNRISMTKLLEPSEKDTIVIMTCAGKLLDGGDATHRLIITATR